MLAAQNKYWGNSIEEVVEYWLYLGIDHFMVKSLNDTPLVKPNGEVEIETFKKLGRLQNEYGVEFHVHPYNIPVKTNGDVVFLDSISTHKSLYKELLEGMDDQIHVNNLYELIDLHLTVLDAPPLSQKQTVEEGLKNGREFFQSLDLESKLSLETMHDPYRNPKFHILGYRAEHFTEIIGDANHGICIDTGHLFMSEESLRRYLDLPYPVLSVHYNGNIRRIDSHHMPTRDNIKEVELVEGLLKTVSGPIVFEIRNYKYSEDDLRGLIERTKRGVV